MAAGEVVWACKSGHHRLAREDATGLWCPESGHKSTNAMKPRTLYRAWSPEEPAEGWGRRCCRSYPEEPHRPGCRYYDDTLTITIAEGSLLSKPSRI